MWIIASPCIEVRSYDPRGEGLDFLTPVLLVCKDIVNAELRHCDTNAVRSDCDKTEMEKTTKKRLPAVRVTRVCVSYTQAYVQPKWEIGDRGGIFIDASEALRDRCEDASP